MAELIRYRGFDIESHAMELPDGTYSVEVWVYDRRGAPMSIRKYFIPDAAPTEEAAINQAIALGKQAIEQGLPDGDPQK
jgi:hypothetical protein